MYKFRVTTLPLNKQLLVSLKYIFGISWHKVNYILSILVFLAIFL